MEITNSLLLDIKHHVLSDVPQRGSLGTVKCHGEKGLCHLYMGAWAVGTFNHIWNNSQQYGFIKGRSTTTAIIKFTELIIEQLEEGCTSKSILLDFSKAFDCLSHKLLLLKLNGLGIRGGAAQWFNSYLSNRKQLK